MMTMMMMMMTELSLRDRSTGHWRGMLWVRWKVQQRAPAGRQPIRARSTAHLSATDRQRSLRTRRRRPLQSPSTPRKCSTRFEPVFAACDETKFQTPGRIPKKTQCVILAHPTKKARKKPTSNFIPVYRAVGRFEYADKFWAVLVLGRFGIDPSQSQQALQLSIMKR